MKLKTVTARSMPQALAEVKRALGSNAVVLHTRTLRRGGILGLGAKTYVEVTAADGRELGRKRRAPSQHQQRKQQLLQAAREHGGSARPATATHEEQPAATGATGELIRRTYAAARAQLEPESSPAAAQPDLAQPIAASAASAATTATAAPPQAAAPANDQLADEMRAIRRMVAQMAKQSQQRRDPAQPSPDMPDKLFEKYLALLEQEVSQELADEIMQQVRDQLDQQQLDDDEACRAALREAVAQLLPADADAARIEPAPDERPRTIALVGPTGVGKTTTIAKLAATFKLKQHKKVALFTLDTYRIAAVEQLKTYANIIGVPLTVVKSPDELAAATHRARDCDVVLIDTAGRSQRDDPRLEELERFIAAAEPHEVHLVLSSTCSQPVLMDTIERFSRIHTDRVIFTKLDEAVNFGVVLNVMRKVRKQLSYITTGQEVPHQIEPGRPHRLAELVLGEGSLNS